MALDEPFDDSPFQSNILPRMLFSEAMQAIMAGGQSPETFAEDSKLLKIAGFVSRAVSLAGGLKTPAALKLFDCHRAWQEVSSEAWDRIHGNLAKDRKSVV